MHRPLLDCGDVEQAPAAKKSAEAVKYDNADDGKTEKAAQSLSRTNRATSAFNGLRQSQPHELRQFRLLSFGYPSFKS